MTKYIVKSYLALINRFEAFAKNLGSFGLAVIYTVGHIWIAILCAAYIFDASLNLAAVDAFKVDYYLRLLKESIPYFPKTAIAKKENGRFERR